MPQSSILLTDLTTSQTAAYLADLLRNWRGGSIRRVADDDVVIVLSKKPVRSVVIKGYGSAAELSPFAIADWLVGLTYTAEEKISIGGGIIQAQTTNDAESIIIVPDPEAIDDGNPFNDHPMRA